MTKRGGFTLVELLVVVAIIAILAAVLFPVFNLVKGKAKAASCISNYRQVSAAVLMYHSDYDDRFVLSSYGPTGVTRKSNGRTWVQSVLPYVRDFTVFTCPADTGERPALDSTFDGDLEFGDTYSKYYQASMRSNVGLNYLYLSPIILTNGIWAVVPRSMAEVASPSRTIQFVDSIYERDGAGRPVGGGSYLVVAPCRYAWKSGGRSDSMMPPGFSNSSLYEFSKGWDDSPISSRVYGGAWNWHGDRVTVSYLDGSVRPLTVGGLTAGCSAQPRWLGLINDESAYLWDLN